MEMSVRRFKRYPEYKDSGVEWLGEIPAHWAVKRLKYVAPDRISKLDVKPDDAVYVGLEHVESWTGRLLLENQPETVDSVVGSFKAGDVLFGKLRPYLAKVARPDFDGVCTSEILPLRPVEECSQSYVMYQLLNEPYIRWLDSLTYGTKMPRVSHDQIAVSFVSLPPPAEQRAIASFLDRETARIDALVAKKEWLIALLQEQRIAIITRAVTKGLDPNVPMKESGGGWLGEIPVHWSVRKLKHVCQRVFVGIAEAATFAYMDDGVPMLRSTDVRANRVRTDHIRRIDRRFAGRLLTKQLRTGDIVTVRTGNAGVSAVVPAEYDGGQCFTLVVSRPTIGQDSRYFCYWLNAPAGQQQFAIEGMGTAQINISVPIVQNVIVCVPPSSEQAQVADFVEGELVRCDGLISKIQEAVGRLKELRTALISAAVTGKIDVREEVA
jgi:type I restriction enzyme S subunit